MINPFFFLGGLPPESLPEWRWRCLAKWFLSQFGMHLKHPETHHDFMTFRKPRTKCWVTNWAEPNSLKCSLRPGGPWRPTCSSWCSKPQTSGDREKGDPMGNDNVRWHPISEGWNGWNIWKIWFSQQSICDQLEILIHDLTTWWTERLRNTKLLVESERRDPQLFIPLNLCDLTWLSLVYHLGTIWLTYSLYLSVHLLK